MYILPNTGHMFTIFAMVTCYTLNKYFSLVHYHGIFNYISIMLKIYVIFINLKNKNALILKMCISINNIVLKIRIYL